MKIGRFDVAHGDRVTFRSPRRSSYHATGTVNGLLVFPTHLVLDMGGAHGTPRVVYPDDIIVVRKATTKE